LAFLNFCWVFQKFSFFCVTLYKVGHLSPFTVNGLTCTFFGCAVFPYCTVPYYLSTPHVFAVCLCGGRHWQAHPPGQDILLSIHHNLINNEMAVARILCVSLIHAYTTTLVTPTWQ